MGTQLVDVFPFDQQVPRTQEDIISSWFDLDDDSSYTPIFQQELQDLENHFFHFETDDNPLITSSSSSSTCLPIPPPEEESPFILDLFSVEEQNHHKPVDVCDSFLNDYDDEFGLIISPTDDLSSSYSNNLNDQSGFMNQLEPMVINNKTTDDDDDDEEDEEEDNEDEKHRTNKRGTLNCKNLVSERKRRKRLSNQLLSLRALVPNITKMDKRSVLIDALSYLRNIHQETEKLQKQPNLSDLKESCEDGILRIPRTSPSSPLPKPTTQITEIDTEKIEDKRFVVKITCKGGGGGGGGGVGSNILRVLESLDFEITYTCLQQLQPQEFLVTIFIRVRKQGKMTEEKLKDCIISMALKTGFHDDLSRKL